MRGHLSEEKKRGAEIGGVEGQLMLRMFEKVVWQLIIRLYIHIYVHVCVYISHESV